VVTSRLLDGARARGVWGEFPVYLFRGFVRRVLASVVDEQTGESLNPRMAIDREEMPLQRSLVSQILKRLRNAGALKAIGPLVSRDGCINTIASLIGEIQRASRTPAEFQAAISARAADLESAKSAGQSESAELSPDGPASPPRAQIDFDRDTALAYATYADALDRFGLADEDSDQLRALSALRGELDGRRVVLPWIETVELLVLDGFFDFTPAQGEILRALIPALPNVIVNFNYDERNEEIFRPFKVTIDQLESIADFEEIVNHEPAPIDSSFAILPERLFNPEGREASLDSNQLEEPSDGAVPAVSTESSSDRVHEAGGTSASPENGERVEEASANGGKEAGEPQAGMPVLPVALFECSDRDTEIHAIAKEIKTLITEHGYKLSEIALVVRERAAYADTIARALAAESIPCDLDRRVEILQVPAARACVKLFRLLKEPPRDNERNPKANELAHLMKTGYFRISPADLGPLAETFQSKFAQLLEDEQTKYQRRSGPDDPAKRREERERKRRERRRAELGIGRWTPDILENVIAYVGSDLGVKAWLERARQLLVRLPSTEAARSLLAGSDSDWDDGAAATVEEESSADDGAVTVKRNRPAPVPPAAIAWTLLVMEHLRRLIVELPEEGKPEELRVALMTLLERFEFSNQAKGPFHQAAQDSDMARAALDLRGLESLRRAFAAAIRSFSLAAHVVPSSETGESVKLAAFLDEVERCLYAQTLRVGASDRDGLRVLEATDVRGLRFRAIFIAGLIEGGFPLRASRDWLYPHEERERLKKYGVILEDISSETLLKEEHYFYQACCRATERLYLTRPLALDDGSETVASYYIEELKSAIALEDLDTKQIRGDVDTRQVAEASAESELAVAIVRQSERHRHQGRSEGLWPTAQVAELLARAGANGYLSGSALRRIDIERERAGRLFGSFDGEISNPDLRAMLAARFGGEYVYSASGFNAYGNCPYKFFASRVLRLEPRSEAALDLQAIDAGKLLHDVLQRFFERHRKEFLPALDRDKLQREMAEVADEVFDEHERLVPPLNQRIWKLDREIRKLILEQVLLYELSLQGKTDKQGIRPAYFELAFGRVWEGSDPGSSAEHLRLARPGGADETALVQGRIDRVDVSDRVAIAYDYKLSQGAKLEDIEAGREVQIPIYLAALEELFLPGYALAGGGYYKLYGRGPRLNRGLYRLKFAEYTDVSSRHTKLDDVNWQRVRRDVVKLVWEFIDGMRTGRFWVDPSRGKETCRFCDYSAVCRYDSYRINRKRSPA
jgi:ATP-dependent helicase/DNAse subunit B